jgi:hypothetical protein
MINLVKETVLTLTNATSLKQALDDFIISKRTFNRKRPIAELFIGLLDDKAYQKESDNLAAVT